MGGPRKSPDRARPTGPSPTPRPAGRTSVGLLTGRTGFSISTSRAGTVRAAERALWFPSVLSTRGRGPSRGRINPSGRPPQRCPPAPSVSKHVRVDVPTVPSEEPSCQTRLRTPPLILNRSVSFPSFSRSVFGPSSSRFILRHTDVTGQDPPYTPVTRGSGRDRKRTPKVRTTRITSSETDPTNYGTPSIFHLEWNGSLTLCFRRGHLVNLLLGPTH